MLPTLTGVFFLFVYEIYRMLPTLTGASLVFTSDIEFYPFIIIIIIIKKVCNARLGEGDLHTKSPKTPAPKYLGKQNGARSIKGIGPALETRSLTPSNTESI